MQRRRQDRSSGDFDPNQKLKHENKQLKREVKRLRKLLQQVEDAEETKKLMYLVEMQRQEDKILHESNKEEQLGDLKERWACHECSEGVMLIQIFKRRDGVFYFRRCQACGNKTRMKKYSEEVNGITPAQFDELRKD